MILNNLSTYCISFKARSSVDHQTSFAIANKIGTARRHVRRIRNCCWFIENYIYEKVEFEKKNPYFVGTAFAAYINFGVSASHLLSASVMSAPASLSFAKLFYPESEKSKTRAEDIEIPKG